MYINFYLNFNFGFECMDSYPAHAYSGYSGIVCQRWEPNFKGKRWGHPDQQATVARVPLPTGNNFHVPPLAPPDTFLS